MIKLEVVSSPHTDEIGIYPYQFNEVILGSNYKCDLILTNIGDEKDPVKLFILEQDLMLETTAINQFVILNGKKMSGRLRLKANDRITLGPSEVKILGFERNKTVDDFPYEKYEKILLNDGPQKDLVIAIENELKKLS